MAIGEFMYQSINYDFSINQRFDELISLVFISKLLYAYKKSEAITVNMVSPLAAEFHTKLSDTNFMSMSSNALNGKQS